MSIKWNLLLASLLSMTTIAHSQIVLEKLDEPFERWYITKEPVPDDFEQNPLKYHPNYGYKHADELFNAGQQEEAVYWMYQSQLRYRILIDCHKRGPWDTDYDTFVALGQDVQAEQNKWLGGDIQLWVDTLDQVMTGYNRKSDLLFKKNKCEASEKAILEGMDKMRNMLLTEYETMRAQRAEGGLENRTSGPVVDNRLTKDQ